MNKLDISKNSLTAYLLHIDSDIELKEEYLELISKRRKDKIVKFRFEKDKKRSLLCGLLIRHIAGNEMGFSKNKLKLGYGKYGKPYFSEFPEYHFSVSHTDKKIVYAHSDKPLGIDIEEISSFKSSYLSIAKKYFTSDECRYIFESNDKEKRFFEIWTSKEAFVKCTGEGLYRSLNSFNVLSLPSDYRYISRIYKEAVITACCNGSESEMNLKEITLEELLNGIKTTSHKDCLKALP